MALNLVNKINNKLKFLHRKNTFLTPALGRLSCNALIRSHFDCARSAWYPNLTKKIKERTQTTQNKCMRFLLAVRQNWLPMTYRFKQCVNSIVLRIVMSHALII